MVIKRRRTLIKIFSFTVTAFIITAIAAFTGIYKAYMFRMTIEYSYQRALSELADHVDNISIALNKGLYASTTAQLAGLSSEIWSESGAAKADISQLSITDVNLGDTTKYLSQVGDYANSLSRKITANQKVTDEDRKTMKTLYTYANQLSVQLGDITTDIQAGKLTLFKAERVTEKSLQASASPIIDGFQSIEENMSGLPSIIYDGPFADNVMQKKPAVTTGLKEVSQASAQNTAAKFMKADSGSLKYTGITGGNMPTYNFSYSDKNISVSKNGGIVVRLLDSRSVSKTQLSQNEAIDKATQYIRERGYTSMAQTYYLIANNILVVNFAYTTNDIICYTDLVKVGVALDNGDIVSFDATGYLMNHKNRVFATPGVTKGHVTSLLNPLLKVQKISLALIPTEGGGEVLCYEYKCINDQDQYVLDYFNVENAYEQQILILLETEGGTLAI